MTGEQQLSEGVPVERFEYEDEHVLAADLGAATDATVDVVGDTAIVVAGTDQYDLELPGSDAQAFIRNGVLTVEVTDGHEEADS